MHCSSPLHRIRLLLIHHHQLIAQKLIHLLLQSCTVLDRLLDIRIVQVVVFLLAVDEQDFDGVEVVQQLNRYSDDLNLDP